MTGPGGERIGSQNEPSAREKLRIALECREAMRAHRRGRPVGFDPGYWPKRWSDPTYLGDGPWGA